MASLIPERPPPRLSFQPSTAPALALSLLLHLLPLAAILLELLSLDSMPAGLPPPISITVITPTDVPDDAAATATASNAIVPDPKPLLAAPTPEPQPVPAATVQPNPPQPAEQAPQAETAEETQPDYNFLKPARPIEVIPAAPTAPAPSQQEAPSAVPAAPAAEDTIGPDPQGSGFGASLPSTGDGGLGFNRNLPQQYLRLAVTDALDDRDQPQLNDFLNRLFACGVHILPNSTPLLTVEVEVHFNMNGFIYAADLVHPEIYADNPDYQKTADMLMAALHNPACSRIRLPMVEHVKWGTARLLLSQKQEASAPIVLKPPFGLIQHYPNLPSLPQSPE